MEKGIVFNVQRFTIHDGPGMRTELFLKGCPLHCRWCSNPESLAAHIQPGVYRKKCISHKNCASCEAVCPQGAINYYRGKIKFIDRSLCINCLKCAAECPSEAIKQWGKEMTVEECMKVIEKDRGYYERSGGGVTLSGGDPLMQPKFVKELLTACKDANIHTCLESTFCFDWERIEDVLPYSDLLISDLKIMDSAKHKEYAGVPNTLILENFKKIINAGKDLILRIPVIPGVNDDQENIEASADFIINELQGKVRTLQLLSFMRLGEEKYESLGMPYEMEYLKVNRRSFQKKVESIAEYFNGRGIHCLVGTKEKQ